MSLPAILSSQPWVERLGWTLLHFLWQGAAITILFIAARTLFGRRLSAPARYALACLALAAMAAAPVLTFSLGNGLNPASAARTLTDAILAVSASSGVLPVWTIQAPGFWQAILPWIVVSWLAGAGAFSVRLAGGWVVTLRMRAADVIRPAPAEWQRTLDRLIARIGVSRRVRLAVSSMATTPIVTGWIRPVILTPLGMLAGLPADRVEALLAHELAHIRRHDYLVNLLQSVAEVVLFYHPAVWWLSNVIRAERELCCDDLAVRVTGDAFTYALALAELETCRPERFRTVVAANGGSLADRIRRLLDPAPRASYAPSGPAVALALMVFLGAGIGGGAILGTPPVVGPVAAGPSVAAWEPKPSPALAGRRGGNLRWMGDAAAGRSVGAIEVRGFTDEAGSRLLARLPVREGDVLTANSLREVRRMTERLPGRVECGIWLLESGEAVLRIHPAGRAGAPLIHRK
jgi:beta-lactamase regulating signal transducer with metallopeptidase domain